MKGNEIGMLDLPAARHLLHHQFGIHQHIDLGGAQPGRLIQPGDQAAVLGDVVGGTPDRLLALGQHRGVVGRPHHRAVSRRPRVAAGPAIRFDDHLHWSPSLTRNRIAPHSGQRNTSSSAAAEIRASPPRSISIRHAPHRRPCSRPAPAPPSARWRSYSDTSSESSDAVNSSRRERHWCRVCSIAASASSRACWASASSLSSPSIPLVHLPAESAALPGAPSPRAANPPDWTGDVAAFRARAAGRRAAWR